MDNNEKRSLIAPLIVLVLFGVNLALTLKLSYQTEHKRIYESNAYIFVLVLILVIYIIRYFTSGKKSTSDLAILIFGFFLLWELAYKLG